MKTPNQDVGKLCLGLREGDRVRIGDLTVHPYSYKLYGGATGIEIGSTPAVRVPLEINQAVGIGTDVVLWVYERAKGVVHLAIQAPKSLRIIRQEVLDRETQRASDGARGDDAA